MRGRKHFLIGLLVCLLLGASLIPRTEAYSEPEFDITRVDDLLEPYLISAEEEPEPGSREEGSASNGYVYGRVYDSSRWDPYSCWYYYNRLPEAYQQVWDKLYASCVAIAEDPVGSYSYTAAVSVPSGWTTSGREAANFALYFRVHNPQFYFLTNGYSYYYSSATNNITSIRIGIYQNFRDGAARAAATSTFLNRVSGWVNQVKGQSSDFNKALKAHELIRENVYYNNAVLSGDNMITESEEQAQYTQSAYSAACMGTTVCAGYSQLYAMLCNAADVDTFSVTSADHQWNKCRVNDSWYNVDVTWDDTGYGYRFFCRSDNAMLGIDSRSHSALSHWSSLSLPCTRDNSSAGTGNCGSLPAPGGQLYAPAITLKQAGDVMTVTMSCSSGTPIYYTTDGTTPSQANSRSRIYSGSFQIASTAQIRAMSAYDGYWDSAIAYPGAPIIVTSYPIYYQLGGGTNASANPDRIYEGGSVTLQDPVRNDGAIFRGWYLDPAYTQPVTTLSTSMARTGGAYYLYARWEIPNVDGWTYEVLSDGSAKITGYTVSGDIVVPGTLNGRTVTRLAKDLFADRSDITSVYLPAGLNYIGEYDYYFWNCTSLREILVNPNNPYFTSVDGVLFTKDLSTLLFYPIGKTTEDYATPAETTLIQKYAIIYKRGFRSLRLTNPNISWGTERFRKFPCALVVVTAGGTAEQFAASEVSSGYSANTGNTVDYPFYAVVGREAPTVKTAIQDHTSVKLTWNKVSGISSYVLLKRITGWFYFSAVSETTYLDASPEEGDTCYYLASAVDPATGLLRLANVSVSGKKVAIPKLAPDIKGTVLSASGRVKLTWKAVEGAARYYIWRNPGGNYTYRIGETTETSWTDPSAAPGTTNKYTVQVVLKDGTESRRSDPVTLMTRCAAPAVTVTHVASSGKPKLTWKAVTGAVQYKVYRSTAKDGKYTLLKTTENTSYTHTGAKINTKYYYKVKAISEISGADSSYSSVKYTTVDLARPAVSITQVASSGKPKLTWKAVTGAVQYKVYRSTAKDGKYTLLKTTESTAYTDTGAKVNKKYYYKVKAISGTSGADSAYSAVKSATVDLARPAVSITTSSGKPKLTWKAITGATGYKIYRATSKNGEYKLVKTVTGKSYTDKTAKKGKTCYYKVRAVSKVSAAASAYSTVKSVKCKK